HVLHHVNPTARRSPLIAKQHVRRADRGADATEHAAARDLVDFRDTRVLELFGGEIRLHKLLFRPRRKPSDCNVHPLRIKNTRRIKGGFELPGQTLEARIERLKYVHGSAYAYIRADKGRVAAVLRDHSSNVRGPCVRRFWHFKPD